MGRRVVVLWVALLSTISAFVPQRHRTSFRPSIRLQAASSQQAPPLAFSSGSSTQASLVDAIEEACNQALKGLPKDNPVIDLAIVSVSSLYDGGLYSPATMTVPTIAKALEEQGRQVRQLIGSSVAGSITSTPSSMPSGSCIPAEYEGIPTVSITFAQLPDVTVQTFHIDDIPDDYGRMSATEWNRIVGLDLKGPQDQDYEPPLFLVLPSPASVSEVDPLLQGLATYYPDSQTIGGVASTVSSLSRAKLYQNGNCFTKGSVGVAFQGDIAIDQMMAQGAKPVGGIYQIVKGQESTISVIVLDEVATNALQEEEEDEEEEEEVEEEPLDARAAQQQFYAKARIPKPVLAEANFLMRTLSDDDQAFMRRQLLLGLDQGGGVGRTASELKRLAEGEGHRFSVHPVASAGMKDGSVTLPLGSVDIQPGTRLRFFVRESEFAKKEINALWTGYKKRVLDAQFGEGDSKQTFTPAACFLVPTLDRGNKFFLGKQGFESNAVAQVLSGVSCISGFYCNGVIGRMDIGENAKTGVQGSASGYFLFGSKSGRPIYSPAAATVAEAERKEQEAMERAAERAVAAEDAKRIQRAKEFATQDERAPRSEDGELILKRREVHAGRAMTVSTVEWSVAEKTARPTSALEGFMWDKETQVDRLRERVPLANLVSQCRLSSVDPTAPKPRDWVGPLKQAAREKGFIIIPDCKRMEPTTGSLRKRYDLAKLIREFTIAGVPVTSVNCDSILFGGSLEDVTKARAAASSAAAEIASEDGVIVPPILASDLILYPYQLYKLRLAGADAVNLFVGALASKDLKYLSKIAQSLQLQCLFTVTSEVQIKALSDIPEGCLQGVIVSNRELEDFSFDMTGEQALRLLKSDALQAVKEAHPDLAILVEGRVGIIERPNEQGQMSSSQYIKELKEAGAIGAVVGGGLTQVPDTLQALESLQDCVS